MLFQERHSTFHRKAFDLVNRLRLWTKLLHYGTTGKLFRVGLMISTQVRHSESSGFKSRSGQIAYFHSITNRISTLGTGDVPRGSDST